MDFLGRYKLVERIAIGGMAEIFLAEQPGPAGFSRRVAIKRILPHRADDADFVEMFLNEARLSALLNHPNIVQIYDLGEADGQYYIAMEYVDGYDLGQLLDKCEERKELMPAPYISRVIAQAAAGLNYAHAYCDPQTNQPLNLIHRDISLPNIMLSKDGVVKLLDFGIAKAATTEQRAPTQTGVLKGKISYMSPEYLMGETIDWRHDLFALGVVMFELATSQKPFEAKGDVQMLQAILTQSPRDPQSLNHRLPRQFVDCVMRMLAKDPRERYQNGSEIQASLEQFVFDSIGGEITHAALSQFVHALFGGQPLPDPSLLASQHSSRAHTPSRSSGGFQPQAAVPRSTSDVRSYQSQSSDGWMEETRAISLNTTSLAGLSAAGGADSARNFGISEQTAVLQLDSLEGTLDRSGGTGVGQPGRGFDDGQPMTQELDSSMIPPPPDDDSLSTPLTPLVPPADALDTNPSAETALATPAMVLPPEPENAEPPDSGQGIPKWLLLVIPLCLLCGGLSVLAWKLATKNKATATADAGSLQPRREPVNVGDRNPQAVARPTQRGPRTQPPTNPPSRVGKRSPLPANPRAPRVVTPDSGAPPLPSFGGPDRQGTSQNPTIPPIPNAQRDQPPLPPVPTNAVTPPRNRRLQYGIYLKSYPSTIVYWQGKKWGSTPVELPLTPGTHHLILRRYRPYIRYPYQVTLQEGEYLQKTVSIQEGFLDVRVTPWAQVTIDGHYIGRTPLSPIRLYAGYHTLRLVNSERNKRSSRTIFISGKRKLKVRVKFR